MAEAESSGFLSIIPTEEDPQVSRLPTICPKCNEPVEPEQESLLRTISQPSVVPLVRSLNRNSYNDMASVLTGRRSNLDLRLNDPLTSRQPLSAEMVPTSDGHRDTAKQRNSMIDNPRVSFIDGTSSSAMSQKVTPSSGNVSRKSFPVTEEQTELIERLEDAYVCGVEHALGNVAHTHDILHADGTTLCDHGEDECNLAEPLTDNGNDDDSGKHKSRKHARFTFDLTCNSEFISAAQRAAEQAEEFLLRIWRRGWDVVTHSTLPTWLRDNEYLRSGHRPELHNYAACFRSMFRIHTETGNIWTHLLGAVAFIGVAAYFLTRPSSVVQWQEKVVFGTFFVGAICCLGLSCSFHTFCCHSQPVGKMFAKFDYCGIAVLIIASFVPWLYYSFYCDPISKIIYLVITTVLGITCIIASLWDKFAEPNLRPLRAGVFIGFGLSGIVPAIHIMVVHGFVYAVENASLGWLSLMALLYIGGALIYAFRIPERLLPGKFDIWGQSHQIFHVFVVAAAFVHFHGITAVATYRLTLGDCVNVHLASELDALY